MEELLFGFVFILIVINVIYGLVTGGSSSKHSYDDDFEFQRECNQRQFDEHIDGLWKKVERVSHHLKWVDMI